MHDRLRDPIWQFVGAYVALVALIVAVLFGLESNLHFLATPVGTLILVILILPPTLLFVGLIVPVAVIKQKTVTVVSAIQSFFRSTWGRRTIAFGLLLGLLVLEYIRSQLSLWTVALFALQLLLLLGLIFQILTSERETRDATSRLQTFIYREEFRDFQRDLGDWEYSGEWRTERDDDGCILVVTQSEGGGIAKPCLSWTDYVFEFETKIIRRNTSWIIRAKDPYTYVMLQCQPQQLRPHFRVDGKWAAIKRWTDPITVPLLPVVLRSNTWFGVHIEVRGTQVVVTVTVNGRETEILNRPLLECPPAPVSYPTGSVGFRESSAECAHFRNVRVRRI